MEKLELPNLIKPRKKISASETPLLEQVCAIIEEHRPYWPLSLRTVHYRLLSHDVVRNAKSRVRYSNDYASYHLLGDLLLRARINGVVSWEAIEDSTRQSPQRDLFLKYFNDATLFISTSLKALERGDLPRGGGCSRSFTGRWMLGRLSGLWLSR